jgi:hypothetical protein
MEIWNKMYVSARYEPEKQIHVCKPQLVYFLNDRKKWAPFSLLYFCVACDEGNENMSNQN